MKIFALSILSLLVISNPANAQFQPRRTCGEQSRALDNVLRRSTLATSELSSSLYDLNRLGTTLEQGAQVLSVGHGNIDIRRELEPLIADVENTVRSAQSPIASALADLRDTPNHGSYARTLAGIAAGKLENANNIMVSAAQKTATIKNRVDQLNVLLKKGGSVQIIKQNIDLGLRQLQSVDRAFAGLSELSRLPLLTRDYVAYCSNQVEITCASYRSELSRAVERVAADQRDVETAALELRRLRTLIAQVSQSLNVGNVPDLNATINDFIDRSLMHLLQDASNNLITAASVSRQASNTESGVLFDQLVRTAIPASENAERLANSSLTGLNGLRTTVNTVAVQIATTQNPNAVLQLRQAARDTALTSRRISDVVSRLGGSGFNAGDLGFATRSLDDHRRYCEIL